MSEIKRVVLNTLEPQKVSDKVNKKVSKTIRISLALPESNEDECPEYNYKDQLALAKRRSKVVKEKVQENGEVGLDPFADNDDDVRRIAFEMEAKYGTGVMNKKKRKGRKDDYADIGMGYDESDSFIDNTDGYDEIIPQNVTTLHGGFYINCGALEFKTDDEATSDISSSSKESDTEKPAVISKKRVLDSSDDSEEVASESQSEKKPKLAPKNSMQVAIKKKLFSSSKIQVKKKKMISPYKKTVKDMLRDKRSDENGPPQKKEDNIEESHKENKKPMSISSVADTIESVIKQQTRDALDLNENRNKQNADTNSNDIVTSKTSSLDAIPSMEGESSQEGQVENQEIVKLPENLPSDISEIVNKIRQAAIDYKGDTRKHFFTDEVNSNLLSLERKCKILGKSSRVRVYEHLSAYIRCKKETLIRRAKMLVLEEEEARLIKFTAKLKDIIDCIMPPLLANYEVESQKVLQKKFSKDNSESEENKHLKLPRRRFQWNDESRKLVKDILTTKKKCLLLEGKHRDNLEVLIVAHLKTKILPLWPDGWMHVNNLKKVYNSMTDSRMSNSSKVTNSSYNICDNTNTTMPRSSTGVTISPVVCKKNTNTADIPLTNVNSGTSEHVANSSVQIVPVKDDAAEAEKPSSQMDKAFNEYIRNIEKDLKRHSEQNSKSDNSHLDVPKKLDKRKTPVEIKLVDTPKRHCESLQLPGDTNVIIRSTHHEENPSSSTVIPQDSHCQLIDLSEKSRKSDFEKKDNQHVSMEMKTTEIIRSKELKCDQKKSVEVGPDFGMDLARPEKNKLSLDNRHLGHATPDLTKPHKSITSLQFEAKPIDLEVVKSHKNRVLEYDLPKTLIPILSLDNQTSDFETELDKTKSNKSNLSLDSHTYDKPAQHKVSLEGRHSEPRPSDLEPSNTMTSNFSQCHSKYYPDPKPFASIYSPSAPSSSSLKGTKSEDDIQMVMENLKALQNFSCTPLKAENSNPVSVIAYSKNFSSKSNPPTNNQNAEKCDFPGGFQDEFQKQFMNTLQHMSANSSTNKTNYRCS